MKQVNNRNSCFSKLNDLYLKVLNINRGMLDGRSSDFLARNCQDREVALFFTALDITLIILMDRIRQIKLEIFENIPQVQKMFSADHEVREKLSELIYEYVFSGLAICFLDNIIKNDGKIYRLDATITPEVVWDIFSQKTAGFKIPDMHEFLYEDENSDVSSMFKLMFDSMYDRLKLQIPSFYSLKDSLNILAKELIEKSLVEGMLVFKSYEEAVSQITDMRINS